MKSPSGIVVTHHSEADYKGQHTSKKTKKQKTWPYNKSEWKNLQHLSRMLEDDTL